MILSTLPLKNVLLLFKDIDVFSFSVSLFLILIFVLCLCMPRLPVRLWLRFGFALLLLFSFLPFAHLLLSPLENAYPKVSLYEAPQADAVVVLAGMIQTPALAGEEPEFTGSVDRILQAEKLLLLAKAPLLLISGATALISQKGEAEAAVLKKWLEQRGHASKRIIAETVSRNTAESAVTIEAMALRRGWKKVLLVTSAFHMPRSMACFRKTQVELIPIPVDYQGPNEFVWPEAALPSLAGLNLSTLALREYIGIIAYKLMGYI